MKRLAIGLATVTLFAGTLGVTGVPASAGTTLKPRASTPKALGFGASWSLILNMRECDPESTATRCRSGLWVRPDKVGKPSEFNQNVGYEAAVYRSTRAARRAVIGRVAEIRAFAPPAEPASFSTPAVRRKVVAGTRRTTVSYTYLGPEQRERLYIAQKGRRTVSVALGSDTPLGLLPVAKKSVLWRKMSLLVR